ncbi:MAG: 23S rRNA (guanosine(2251)-2'-O)-methyltransferase RlmB [Nitrospinae bacterium]|nr:23S rRNA (guanosine(2251)-2'-O)-methyltransferase RlmB [Nitrospinota bacterium]
MSPAKPDILYGINPILEALKAAERRCYRIIIEKGKSNPRLKSLMDLCHAQRVEVESVAKTEFQKRYRSYSHQGVVGHFSVKETLALEDLIAQAFERTPQPVLVLPDGIQDPQNLGAIIRSAEALGMQGMILPKHRAVALNETVAKCSSGAIEKLPIAWVTNLAHAIDELKEANFWVVGIDPQGETPCHEFKFEMPTAILIGGEGKGIRPLLRKACDFSVSIPMTGSMSSLNASAAGAVIFYEILRQRRGQDKK